MQRHVKTYIWCKVSFQESLNNKGCYLLDQQVSKSGSTPENEQEPLKLEAWIFLWCLPNTWIPVLHSLYSQVACTAKGKLGAQKESRTRFNHSYGVFFKLNFQSFVVLAGLEIPSFLVIFWSFHSLTQIKPGSQKK